MEDSFAKVMSLAAFIVLGHLLRRFNILKDQAFAAISALVMNVTLPCVILTNLNGVRIEGDMLLIAGLGLLTNIIFLVWGLFLSRNIADTQWRDFVRLNVGGYSVGPFAVPYVQSFFPTTGLMATCMFDVGNCVMAGGGTFAVIAGTRVKTTLWRTVKLVVSKLVRSGPLVTFAFVGLMSVLDMRLPDGVITSTAIGAHANTFLCMIMIGESISFSMGGGKMGKVLKLLASRWVVCILIALGVWHFLPFEEEIRMALTLTCPPSNVRTSKYPKERRPKMNPILPLHFTLSNRRKPLTRNGVWWMNIPRCLYIPNQRSSPPRGGLLRLVNKGFFKPPP